MDSISANVARPRVASFADLFTPKLVTVLREGYGLDSFRADVISGLTVAIVALPLSMAIAIASGVTPDRGLYTAIVGGFFVSLLGGSRFQVGGPAGAFIVLVAQTAQQYGVDGVILATLMAGAILIVAGLLRLGTYIKFIPYPVTVGFTAGIAVIILASQIRDLFGLSLHDAEPAALLPKLAALGAAFGTIKLPALLLATLTIALIAALRVLRPNWPGILIGVVVARGRGRWHCRWKPSAPVSAGSRNRFRGRHCRTFRRRRCWQCCPMPSPSRCSHRSNRCYRRWSPMA